jgi:hypothetical protein
MHMRIVRKEIVLTVTLFVTILMSWAWPDATEARRVRNTTRASVNRNANRNLNRNVNINQNRNQNINVNRNVNVHRDIDVDVDHRYYDHYHPVATAVGVAAAATVTAAVIGSIVYSLPPACSMVVVNGISYQNCSGTWYQPQYMGTQVSYVVVNPPR